METAQAEIAEHKGIGHPDSLCDGAVEAAACALSRAYLDAYGAVQHFNLDKALLIGGVSQPRFGGGKLLRPMRLVVCGPVTELPSASATSLVEQSIRDYLVACLGGVGNDIGIELVLRPSAPNLQRVIHEAPVPLANDTSFGVGYAPHSRLEDTVLCAARVLRSSEFRGAFDAAGMDFKVMGRRLDTHLGLTVALAIVDRSVRNVEDYFTLKSRIATYLAGHLPVACDIGINTLDDPATRDESGIYLTVTGLSAEHGDDGEVGRGNRVNGLITPYRPMSLEAAAGKNPAAHVGKLYNVLAHRLAVSIHASIEGVDEVTVRLLSSIGRPVNEPQLAAIDLVAADGLSAARQQQVRELTAQHLAALPALIRELTTGTVAVF
ncbi:methionine adenosyltransferase [Ralstonia solanacearum]|uniref:methionine adenosyltransferase n=1 Tax=Ralstonia solanacearum TaxID=305 RepID=UPI001E2918D4|nr:methionine adenosyltransferase [Ralstonia solanacearum]